MIRDRRGRPTIVFYPAALESLEQAVKTFGHELGHIRCYNIGETVNEVEANAPGKELWRRVFGKLKRQMVTLYRWFGMNGSMFSG